MDIAIIILLILSFGVSIFNLIRHRLLYIDYVKLRDDHDKLKLDYKAHIKRNHASVVFRQERRIKNSDST